MGKLFQRPQVSCFFLFWHYFDSFLRFKTSACLRDTIKLETFCFVKSFFGTNLFIYFCCFIVQVSDGIKQQIQLRVRLTRTYIEEDNNQHCSIIYWISVYESIFTSTTRLRVRVVCVCSQTPWDVYFTFRMRLLKIQKMFCDIWFAVDKDFEVFTSSWSFLRIF